MKNDFKLNGKKLSKGDFICLNKLIEQEKEKARVSERKKLIRFIINFDVEPCCHGLRQRELLRVLRYDKWFKY